MTSEKTAPRLIVRGVSARAAERFSESRIQETSNVKTQDFLGTEKGNLSKPDVEGQVLRLVPILAERGIKVTGTYTSRLYQSGIILAETSAGLIAWNVRTGALSVISPLPEAAPKGASAKQG